MHHHRLATVLAVALSLASAMPGTAQETAGAEVNIAPGMMSVVVPTSDGPVTIERIQDQDAVIGAPWNKIARSCPQTCIQPMQPAPGVTTIGELELIEFLKDPEVLVIDSRTFDFYEKGTIPGAVHMSYAEIVDQLDVLGCEAGFDGWECENARKIAMFCNGPWCGQSPTAIKAILAEGYPADRIFYYRGGMQMWHMFGLTTIKP
ncbi:MAG: rhodanese-like domain-containing protein [Brevirhabdus sp.]